MSCIPGYPKFADIIGSTFIDTYNFPTYTNTFTLKKNINFNFHHDDIKITKREIFDKLNINLIIPKTTGIHCSPTYIEPSPLSRDRGGIPMIPNCIEQDTIERCVRIFRKKICATIPVGLPRLRFTNQPYWEKYQVPDTTFINIQLPNIRLHMDITVTTKLYIGGGFYTQNNDILETFLEFIKHDPSDTTNQIYFTFNILFDFLIMIIGKGLGVGQGLTVFFNMLKAEITFKVENFEFQFSDIVDIQIDSFEFKEDIQVLNNDRYLFVNIYPPDDISFNINVITMTIWDVLFLAIDQYINMYISVNAGVPIPPMFLNFKSFLSNNKFIKIIKDHLSLKYSFYIKFCPLNVVPNTQMLLCHSITLSAQLFTEEETDKIDDDIKNETDKIIDEISKIKLPENVNRELSYILRYMGVLNNSQTFNSNITNINEIISRNTRNIILLLLDEVLSLDLVLVYAFCTPPPLPA